jgi:hypothetical protein
MLQPNKNKGTWKKEQEWLQNWYSNRVLPDPVLNKNYQTDKSRYVKEAKNLAEPTFVDKIDKYDTQGEYDKITKGIKVLNTADPLVYTHEGAHGINIPLQDTQSSMDAFMNVNKNVLPKKKIKDKWVKKNYKEVSNYGEVIGRINSYRQLHNLAPDQEITPELIRTNRASYKKGDIKFETNTDQLYKMFDDEGLSNTLNSVVSNQQQNNAQYAALGGIIKQNSMGKVVKKKIPKYAFGAVVEDPSTALVRNQIAQVKAGNKAMNNPWTQGLDIAGNLAMKVGSSMMQQGIANGEGSDGKGLTGFLAGNQGNMNSIMGLASGMNAGQTFAVGGVAGGVNINAEGGEIVQQPGQAPMELQGASHPQGGMDLTVAPGTEIYSKQVKGPDGKSMAARKKIRESKEDKIARNLSNAPTDKLIRNAYQRTKVGNALIDAQDMQKMQVLQMMDQMQQTFAKGGIVPQYEGGGPVEPLTPKKGFDYSSLLGDTGATFGDALGLFGQYKAATDPMKLTKAQRAEDQPNVNSFLDYGKEGMKQLEKTKGYLQGQQAKQIGDINLDRVGTTSRNRNSARGINTIRALDIATQQAADKAKENVYANTNQMMSSIFGQMSGLANQRDQVVMGGEERRIQNDLADRDAYNTALQIDTATKNEGTQHIAKNINAMKTRKTTGELVNKLSVNFDVDPYSGKLTKTGETAMAKAYPALSSLNTLQKTSIYDGLKNGTYIEKNGEFFTKDGKKLDLKTI